MEIWRKFTPDGFTIEADGNSMEEYCIQDGDLLFFDRALEPESGDIVAIRNEHGVMVPRKYLVDLTAQKLVLRAGGRMKETPCVPEDVLGVLTYVIRSCRPIRSK